MPGGSTPDVSVVIPVRNGERYLAQAIASALDQEGVEVEVIVVDDTSTDKTPEIARSYNERSRYLRRSEQPNHGAAANAGVRLARGDLVCVLDHDDYLLPGKLRRHVELMATHPAVGLSYSAEFYVGPDGGKLGLMRSPLRKGDYIVPGAEELRHLTIQNYIQPCNAIVRRESLLANPFSLDPFAAEWPAWLGIAMHQSIGYIDEPLVCYRLHRNSMMFSGARDTEGVHRQLLQVVYETFGDSSLPRALLAQRRMALANAHLNALLLRVYSGKYREAARSAGAMLRNIRPWELGRISRSAVLRLRISTRLRLLLTTSPDGGQREFWLILRMLRRRLAKSV